MLKILHIIPSLKKGGAERLVLDICMELSKREGIEVCLVALSEGNDYKFLSDKINYRVIPSIITPSLTGEATVQNADLMQFIKSFKPDIMHTHLFEADLVSRWQLIPNIQYFSHCHDNMHQLQNFSCRDVLSKKRMTELYEKKLIEKLYKRCNNHFITISQHTQEYFTSILPKSLKHNVHLLPNAIVCNRFYKNQTKPDTLKLISIGRIDKNKNHQFLIQVVSELKKKYPVYLTLCGDGVEKDNLKNIVASMQLMENIALLGNVDLVEDYLSESHIYVHAALSEAMGLTLLEAMASGLPVVTLNGGGNADIMEDGKNGFIIDEQDPELYAEKISSLWENKELHQQMSAYAQEYTRQFDIKEYVDKLLSLYYVTSL